MIQYVLGDILNSKAHVLVNPVNTVGAMGRGLALLFKKKYPDMFQKYMYACNNNLLTVGKLMICHESDHDILLFPTKEDWRNPSKMEYIEAGLQKFVATYKERNITSIAFSKLGCGNGGLQWSEVKTMMEKYLGDLPIDVYIYI